MLLELHLSKLLMLLRLCVVYCVFCFCYNYTSLTLVSVFVFSLLLSFECEDLGQGDSRRGDRTKNHQSVLSPKSRVGLGACPRTTSQRKHIVPLELDWLMP
jgi:hypothetical protein